MAKIQRLRYWQPAPEAAPELVCAEFDAGDGPLHVHEEWQFGVSDAPSKLSLGAFRRYGVEPGDVTVVAPYGVHSECGPHGEPRLCRLLYVTPAMVNRLFGGGNPPRFQPPSVADPAAAAELSELLSESADGTVGEAEFLGRVERWLARLLVQHAETQSPPRQLPAVQRARAYLQDRPTETAALSEIGEVAGITLSHLVRSFSRAVGLPPRSYHSQVRLARARRLLAEGKPATWVAYECDFADQSHLNRRFKQSYGVTPGAFQAQYLARRNANAATGSTAA